jgi:hypothetical protein
MCVCVCVCVCAQKQMESTHTRILIWLIDKAQRLVLMQKIVLHSPARFFEVYL